MKCKITLTAEVRDHEHVKQLTDVIRAIMPAEVEMIVETETEEKIDPTSG